MDKSKGALSRRGFLKGSSLAMGGLVLSTWLPGFAPRGVAAEATAAGRLGDKSPRAYGAYVRVGHDGLVTVISPKIEMGQGAHTGIAMMVAEELEVPLSAVTIEDAPPDSELYADSLMQFQATGGSTSTRHSWQPLREAGATARLLLIQAAAARWGVDAAQCHAKNGEVFGPAEQKLGYGELVDAASELPLPTDIALKTPEQFTLLGTPAQRIDTPNKVNGKAQFTIDLSVPDMLIASTLTCPVFGGTLRSLDDSAAKKVPGVRDVIKLDNAVAVSASNYWACQQGLKALKVEWDLGENASINSAQLDDALQQASARDGVVAHNAGDIGKALEEAASRFEAVYEQAFLSHSPLEPMTCVAHVRPDACELWVGTQVPVFAQQTAAKISGLPADKIIIHNQLIGGAFGRRLDYDFITQAVDVARHVSYPIKLIWSREEDMTHDMYRPQYADRLTAALDADGKPTGWQHRIAGASVLGRYMGSLPENGVDGDAVEVAIDPIYALPNLLVNYVREEPKVVPVSWWRGVGPLRSTYALECFIDELALNAGADPVDYRLGLMAEHPRAQAVLRLAAEKAGWGNSLPDGQGRGVAVSAVFGSYVATVVEMEMRGDKAIRIKRLVCAIDCGLVTNPTSVQAQMEGGTLFGLSASLFNEILIEQGVVQQTNFHNYRQLRITDAPGVEVHIVPSLEAPGGVGETGTALIGPALVNALHAASGTRLRRLPLSRAGYYPA
ncbi:xanthine dehydrogenase family protein molybdopterin-binding subunit [Halopseudomonas sabulinigri]|uniref:Xanthine dehydrogenase family protein molybdopterin-binding subunit n=1 Tax=Halopseudomonas sabulinigri TaxID=472181 RepID=A0ABP9ZPF1_9GAMM